MVRTTANPARVRMRRAGRGIGRGRRAGERRTLSLQEWGRGGLCFGRLDPNAVHPFGGFARSD